MAQFVYTMHRVGKVVPPKRHILKNISLSFFPGAKIGVLGLNGAGKSTLLRIMAGIDTEIEGEARPQPGIKIGYLPQEPQLNPEHTVRESVEEAVAEVVNALKGLDEVYAKYAEPDADFDKLAAQQGKFEEIIQAHDGHNLNVQLERAADALRLPDWDAKIANLSGGERRRVALWPSAAGKTGYAAARRTDQPPRRRVRRLAGTLPARLRRHRGGDYPRPLLP
ncbi:ABC transporter [Klebsiella pneumoniae]|uniref:ABC transporter n=1 Tax=Klebsiella pneumoniae TaxID=573 RepID=A0A377ZLV9_KLEPN|nr:ABC transporter [Klebsiella pneumoniae]